MQNHLHPAVHVCEYGKHVIRKLIQSSPLKEYSLYGIAIGFLILAYLLPGLIGHDPWRGNDTLHLGPILHILHGEGGWLVPTFLENEPLPEFGPLYYWIASLSAFLLGWLLSVSDAARLATAFFFGLMLYWNSLAAAALYGQHVRTGAILLTIGTLGLVVQAHEIQPAMALLAMQALTFYGAALIPEQPRKGISLTLAGIILSFLAACLTGLALTLPLLWVILLCNPVCHRRHMYFMISLTGMAACLFALFWAIAIAHYLPMQSGPWMQTQMAALNITTASANDVYQLLNVAGWSTWPLWPIAIWALWVARRRLLDMPWILPVASLLLCVYVTLSKTDFRPASLLPLITPLVLLAAAGVPTLKRGAANAFNWFSIMLFTVSAILIWLAWSAQIFDWPPGLARSIARMAPDFIMPDAFLHAFLGLLICIVWIVLMVYIPAATSRGPLNWAMGMTMLWCLAVALLLPWFDNNRNYRPLASSLAEKLKTIPPGCISSLNIDTSHRVAFAYFSNIHIQPADSKEDCRYLLLGDNEYPPRTMPPNDGHWHRIWTYRHGGGKRLEYYELYRRGKGKLLQNEEQADPMILFRDTDASAPGKPLP